MCLTLPPGCELLEGSRCFWFMFVSLSTWHVRSTNNCLLIEQWFLVLQRSYYQIFFLLSFLSLLLFSFSSPSFTVFLFPLLPPQFWFFSSMICRRQAILSSECLPGKKGRKIYQWLLLPCSYRLSGWVYLWWNIV